MKPRNLLQALFLSAITSTLAFAHVYPETLHQRRNTTPDENLHLLRLGNEKGGCSASAIAPNLLITAEHCSEIAGGYFEADPRQTFKTVRTVESSSRYANDYALIEIKWDQGRAPITLKYTREIAAQKTDLAFGNDDATSSKIFILGYPMDRERKASYSYGYLRGTHLYPRSEALQTPDSLYLQVNAPTINGNSGGPVYTGNYKLIGVVSSGGSGNASDEVMQSAEFNSQNPKFWNEMSALYFLYPQMKVLQKLFPHGVNSQVSENGEWTGDLPSFEAKSSSKPKAPAKKPKTKKTSSR